MPGRNYYAPDPRSGTYRALTEAERAARDRWERTHPLPCVNRSCEWHHERPATLQDEAVRRPDG